MEENKELLSNTLALNLALQTIKERCVHLQKRLFALESENSKLKLNKLNNDNRSDLQNSLSEIEDLRAKNAELNLQKTQLTENLTMISTENRKLWKRLSQLTKESVIDEHETSATKVCSQNLIRSKTFTQNSPHQLLKEKLVGHQVGPADDSSDLEDISLINDCGFSAEKMTFGTEENESCDADSKACTDGILNIKKELMKQNSDLKVTLSNWRKMKSADVCSCKKAGVVSEKKPLMVDKILETDRDVTLDYDRDAGSPINFEIAKHETTVLIDLIEQKRAADRLDKICPMCSKFYTQDILFEEFQEHVESHFRDESDIELHSLEKNFEMVSHSVGNF